MLRAIGRAASRRRWGAPVVEEQAVRAGRVRGHVRDELVVEFARQREDAVAGLALDLEQPPSVAKVDVLETEAPVRVLEALQLPHDHDAVGHAPSAVPVGHLAEDERGARMANSSPCRMPRAKSSPHIR